MYITALGKQSTMQISIDCCLGIVDVVSFFSLSLLFLQTKYKLGAGPPLWHLLYPTNFCSVFSLSTLCNWSLTKIFPKEPLDIPWLNLSLWQGEWTQTYLFASVSDLKLVATMHGHCLYLKKVLLMTFQISVEVFLLFTPIWRAAVWISGATFGIYTEENTLFTESGNLKRLLFFPTCVKKIHCYGTIRKFLKIRIFPPRKAGISSLGLLQFGQWIRKNSLHAFTI